MTLQQSVSEALEDKLNKEINSVLPMGGKPWMKHVGKLKDLRKETKRVNGIIARTFERIDPEMWR